MNCVSFSRVPTHHWVQYHDFLQLLSPLHTGTSWCSMMGLGVQYSHGVLELDNGLCLSPCPPGPCTLFSWSWIEWAELGVVV